MVEIEWRRVDAALESIAVRDAEAAQEAEGALRHLAGWEETGWVDQLGLQSYLWHRLASGYLSQPAERRREAAALGELFARLGLDRYARLCRAPEVEWFIDGWENDQRATVRAYRKAMDASGVKPPDLPELAWGEVMGLEELGAHSRVSGALEAAVAGGDLVPGGRGWRLRQQELVRGVLDAPRPEESETWREAVERERLETWLGGVRPRERHAVLRRVEGLLRQPGEPPATALDAVEPVRWLLELAADGIHLTKTHRLHPDLVTAMAERFDWWAPGTRRLEEDVTEVWRTRELAEEVGALRRRKDVLGLTPHGRELLGDRTALWRTAAGTLVQGAPFDVACRELVLALLLAEREIDERALMARIHEVLVADWWHDEASGAPVGPQDVERPVWRLLAELRYLLLAAELGDWRARRVALTSAGRASAIEALRAAAIAPRPWTPPT